MRALGASPLHFPSSSRRGAAAAGGGVVGYTAQTTPALRATPPYPRRGKHCAPMTTFRYIGAKRRAKEHPRFVSGRGRFVADVALPGMKHVALVASPHAARAHRFDRRKGCALRARCALRSHRRGILREHRFARGRRDAPRVTRFALAKRSGALRGRMGGGRSADTRALAEDAAERVEVEYEPLPHVIESEEALKPTRRWCIRRTARTCSTPQVRMGAGRGGVRKRRAQDRVPRGLGPQRHRADRDFRRRRSVGRGNGILDIWASIQMPKFPDQTARALRLPGNAVRVHYDVDVGGSYGVKRGLKHTVLVGTWRKSSACRCA